MKESQMSLINKIFNDKTIRTVWNKGEEKYYVDMVSIISESKDDKIDLLMLLMLKEYLSYFIINLF